MCLARGHGHLVSLHAMPGHQCGKMLCSCTAPPGTTSSILHPGLQGHGRTSELPGKGGSLPMQAPLQMKLPFVSSSGEGFCITRGIYSFKTEAGASNVRAALAGTARCSQQEGYRVWHMPLSVTGMASHVCPSTCPHPALSHHSCGAAEHSVTRARWGQARLQRATAAQPVCSPSALPAGCSRNSFHSAQSGMVQVCT